MAIRSVVMKLKLLVLVCVLLSMIPTMYLLPWPINSKLLLLISVIAGSWYITGRLLRRYGEGLAGLETGLLNFVDGEFSSMLAYDEDDELGDLCQLYNQTAESLRNEKNWLHQRELMLDKVLQNSPQVLLLVNDQQRVVFGNWAAKHFFANGASGVEGLTMQELLHNSSDEIRSAFELKKQGLFSLTGDDGELQTWHLSCGRFLLNNQTHFLFIAKQMTRELSRQEVAVWKKVIRIISHELNNSLGPISSMLHSGKLLSDKLSDTRLERVFDTIDERIQHLNTFVQGYGKFAKLPEPKLVEIVADELLQKLQQQWVFRTVSSGIVRFHADPVQLEQLLINLLKNAHESGSANDEVFLNITAARGNVVLEVSDAGEGMSESVLAQAMVPFYSTKKSGSGLGLALCREIAEAHHGHIALQNKPEGGLTVRVILPQSV